MAKLDPNSLKSEPADLYARTQDLLPAEKTIAKIKGMLVGEEYEYAESTLRGILSTITSTGRVTENQQNAIDRIADNPRRGTRRDRRGGW